MYMIWPGHAPFFSTIYHQSMIVLCRSVTPHDLTTLYNIKPADVTILTALSSLSLRGSSEWMMSRWNECSVLTCSCRGRLHQLIHTHTQEIFTTNYTIHWEESQFHKPPSSILKMTGSRCLPGCTADLTSFYTKCLKSKANNYYVRNNTLWWHSYCLLQGDQQR